MPGDTGTEQNVSTQNPPQSQVSPELVAELVKALAPTLNQVVTSHTKRVEDRLSQQFAQFQKTAPEPAPAAGPQTPEAPKSNDPAVATLQLQLQKLTEQLSASEAQAARIRLESAKERARNELRGMFLENKVRPEYVDVLVNSLEYQNRVVVDENGNSSFVVQVPEYQGGPLKATSVTVAEGVKHFLTEPQAKAFVAAPVPQQTQPSVDPLRVAERVRQAQLQGQQVQLSPAEQQARLDSLTARLEAVKD